MEYTALYRKYRPTVFKDVVGQEHITSTLINQIRHGRVAHAYLFTGSRGVGKTTCARIFARAINCSSPQNGSPCGACEACKALSKSNIDIVEIDAASNNGVDDARELREKVKYPPVNGRYKVFIIDEVHMLSTPAFNALLKTLEEPPAHAVFILATTEAYKLPATILSRCQRYDFRLVERAKLAGVIAAAYDGEGKKYQTAAIDYIAGAAEGSVRDALSIADMCLNAAEVLTLEDVLRVLGAGDRQSIDKLLYAVEGGDAAGVFRGIEEMSVKGRSMAVIARDLAAYARDILVGKTAPELIVDTEENVTLLKNRAERYGVDFLAAVIGIFAAADSELRYSVSPRLVLETACLRAMKLAAVDLAAIEERLLRLERAASNGATVKTVSPATKTAENLTAQSVWGKIITYMRRNESMRLQTLIGGHRDVELKDNALIIWTNGDNYLDFCEESTLQAIERAVYGEGYDLKIKVEKRENNADVDAEILRLKKLVAGAPVNIKK